jgi:hypothetical protein
MSIPLRVNPIDATAPDENKQEEAEEDLTSKLTAVNDKLGNEHEMVNPSELSEMIAEQHRDPSLQPLIAFLLRKERPTNYSAAALVKLERDAAKFTLDPATEPPGLFFVPSQPRRGPMSLIPMTPRLVIPTEYRTDIISMFHDSPFGGHLGITRTYRKLAVQYYWDTMFADAQKYITACRLCQTEKARRREPAFLVKKMDSPTQPFEILSMDFVCPLPRTNISSPSSITSLVGQSLPPSPTSKLKPSLRYSLMKSYVATAVHAYYSLIMVQNS